MFPTIQRLCNPKPPNFTGSASNALSASEHICSPVIAGTERDLNVFSIGIKESAISGTARKKNVNFV